MFQTKSRPRARLRLYYNLQSLTKKKDSAVCSSRCATFSSRLRGRTVRCARAVRKVGSFPPPVATGPRVLNSAPPVLF